MGGEGFWEDSERAASVSEEHALATRRLDAFNSLAADVEDLDGLAEMGAEEQSLQAEGGEQIASVEERLSALEGERLFAGGYDSGGAVGSVNAGGGGARAEGRA